MKRRDVLKASFYVPPAIMSFHAAPSFARPGSVLDCKTNVNSEMVVTLRKDRDNSPSNLSIPYSKSSPEFDQNEIEKPDVRDRPSSLEMVLKNIYEELRLFFFRNKT